MTSLPFLPPANPAPEYSGLEFTKEALERLAPFAVLVGAVYLALRRWTKEAERKAQEAYLRGERLAAYRTRHRWKTSDVRPLLSIGVNEAAQRRMAGLKGKGRPVVKPHRPLEEWLRDHTLKLYIGAS